MVDKVRAWIKSHRKEILKDLECLIGIPSVARIGDDIKPYGESCLRALKEYQRIAEKLGYSFKEYGKRVNEVLVTPQNENKDLGIWTHLDVVEAGEGWTYPPYQLIIRENHLIGRGVRDNKGPAVGILYAMKCLEELEIPQRYGIYLFTGTEEENTMSDIAWLKENGFHFPNYNMVSDSRFPVCYGEKGICNLWIELEREKLPSIKSMSGGESKNSVPAYAELVIQSVNDISCPECIPEYMNIEIDKTLCRIRVHGLAKHAAHPKGSINAISLLFGTLSGKAEAVEGMHKWAKQIFTQEEMQYICHLAKLCEGYTGRGLGIEKIGEDVTAVTTLLLFEEKLQIQFDIRYPITMDGLEKYIPEIYNNLKMKGFDLAEYKDRKPGYISKNQKIVEFFGQAFQRITQREQEAFTICGGTYARALPNAFGYGLRLEPELPFDEAVILKGHGGAHSPDEAVLLEQYEEQLAVFILSLIEYQEKGHF